MNRLLHRKKLLNSNSFTLTEIILLLIVFCSSSGCYTGIPAETGGVQEAFEGQTLFSVQMGSQKYIVQAAMTHEEKSRGLSGNNPLQRVDGMLFLYNPPKQVVFWMKNTQVDLDIAFLDQQGYILTIEHMQANSLQPHFSPKPVSAVLELKSGEFRNAGVEPGDKIIWTGMGSD